MHKIYEKGNWLPCLTDKVNRGDVLWVHASHVAAICTVSSEGFTTMPRTNMSVILECVFGISPVTSYSGVKRHMSFTGMHHVESAACCNMEFE